MEREHKNIRASVIVPVYNAANTLPECLDSILNQTITDFEVICIDDGSSDSSWEILSTYAKKDSRIRIARQKNSGPGLTRNHGIDLALGEYLFFVDADDYIKPEMLETVCDLGQRQDADIVLFDGDRFDTVTRKRIPTYHFLQRELLLADVEVFSIQDCPETIFQISCPAPWSRAYKRNLVIKENLRFSDFPNSEDLYFTYSCIAAANRITFTTQRLYQYRVGQTANVESGKAAAPLCIIEAYLELAHWLERKSLFDFCKKSFGIRFCESIINSIKTIDSELARQAICQRLCDKDIAQLHVLDQSDAFYSNKRAVRQIHYLLQSFHRAPISQPKVSIIIPVFNASDYLADCLESLLNQTMPDFEILCIDDGSTDASTDILSLYSRLDCRIQIVLGKHQGAGEARNQGIELASGEYLFFMDSDDLAADTLLEKTYTAAAKSSADVVVFDIYNLNMKNGNMEAAKYCFRPNNAPMSKNVFSVVDASEHIFQISNPSPWTKLIRREFVLQKQLQYQNLPNTNDAYFAHMVMALADRIVLINERLYIYRIGIIGNIQSKKEAHPECVIDAYMAIRDRLVKERIWTLCEKSWITEFLAVICFTLKTVSTHTAYKRLYQRLCESDVVSTGYMEHEEEYYSVAHYHYDLVNKFLSSTIKFADASERDKKILISGNSMEPVVSVIIPVYNVEDYLAECLDSIRNQTLKNIEIICVDDGSTDNSLNILCQIANEDSRISVLAEKNSGQSAARNFGIQVARGQYLYYMDSDDLLEPDALRFLVEAIEEKELDCIFFGGKTFYETNALSSIHQSYAAYYGYRLSCEKVMSGPDLFTILNQSKEFRASACMQMSKAELIRKNNIWFYDGIFFEDELYTLEVLLRSQKCMTIQEQFYIRRIREGSTVTSTVTISRLVGYLVDYAESVKLLEQFNLTTPQYNAVYQVLDIFLYHIRKFYFALSGDERLWVYAFCTSSQKCVYTTLVKLFNSAKANTGSSALQDKRLNDHDTALRYAQEELTQNRNRLNDHDTALKYAQEELEQNRTRLNDHDIALRYAQEELEGNKTRLNDHDTALEYMQTDIAAINNRIVEMQHSTRWKLGTILTWFPRKLKTLFK